MTTTEFQSKLLDLHESLLRFAYGLTADQDDAKDLLQETVLKALKYSEKYTVEYNFKAWTFTIMKNTFINNYRSNVRHNIFQGFTDNSFFINLAKSSGSDEPDSIFSAKEITQSIEQLKDDFRIPLKMHISGYKYQEIADELNIKLGTVKSRIFFSRKQLMEELSR